MSLIRASKENMRNAKLAEAFLDLSNQKKMQDQNNKAYSEGKFEGALDLMSVIEKNIREQNRQVDLRPNIQEFNNTPPNRNELIRAIQKRFITPESSYSDQKIAIDKMLWEENENKRQQEWNNILKTRQVNY